jgi:hypothetical protein
MANSQRTNSGNSYPDFNNLQNRISKLNPYFSDNYASTFPGYSSNVPSYVAAQTSSPISEGLSSQSKSILQDFLAIQPLVEESTNRMAQNQANLNLKQMAASYPFISQASRDAEALSRFGAKDWLAFKEQQPTAQQNRALAGSGAFSQEAQAIAAQQNAATAAANAGRFLRSYAQA